MKKVCTALLVLLFVLSITTAAYADNTISLDELYLDVTLDDGVWSITRDTQPDDPVWEALGAEPEELLGFMQANGIYLYAFPSDFSSELDLIVSDSDKIESFFDFNLYSDEEILNLYESLGDELLSGAGENIRQFELYQAAEAKYVLYRYDHEIDGVRVTSEVYSTFYNGRAFTFALTPFSGEYTEADAALLRSIVGAAHFTKQLSPSKPTFADLDRENAQKSPLEAALNLSDILEDAVIGGVFGALAYAGFKGMTKKKKSNQGSAHL